MYIAFILYICTVFKRPSTLLWTFCVLIKNTSFDTMSIWTTFQAPRQADYYEISPRPFTIQTSSNNGLYARPPPRPSSGFQQNRNVYQESSQQQQQQQPTQQLIDPYIDNVRQQVIFWDEEFSFQFTNLSVHGMFLNISRNLKWNVTMQYREYHLPYISFT